ncbi:hypothetical protein C2S51_026086 [Perilla frutescens var. frutescens]|nr:hypothetical protein C2S51_026086 [Perilla frutescens var. frutescens]
MANFIGMDLHRNVFSFLQLINHGGGGGGRGEDNVRNSGVLQSPMEEKEKFRQQAEGVKVCD